MTAVIADAPQIPDAVRTAALSVLREGRLQILRLITDPNGKPLTVDAIVHGHSGPHMVAWEARPGGPMGWACSCKNGREGHVCPHVFAAEMVAHCVLPHGKPGEPKARPVRKRGAT